MAIQTVKTGAAVNDGTGDDARTAFTKINQNFNDSANAASREVGEASSNVMQVGAFGLGGTWRCGMANPAIQASVTDLSKTQMYAYNDSSIVDYGQGLGWSAGNKVHFIIGGVFNGTLHHVVVADKNAETRTVGYYLIRTAQNTSVDANGFIKAASPIVKLFTDKIECNDEAKQQPISFEKLGVGDYLVKGSLGFAQEGWYIEMPKDANGNVLVAVIYEQLDNNDISVKTYAKMFDEETGDIVANTARPRDIPSTRWIDLRLQVLPQSNPQPLDTDETVATDAE